MTINDFNSILDESPMMPDYFWRDLKESNQAKAEHIPLALVLQAEEDYNKAFSSLERRINLLTLAKTHRVAFKVIGNQAQLREKIEETKQQLDRPIDLLMICGHGSPDSICLGKSVDYTTKDLCKEDFNGMNTMGKIILMSCSTGQLFAPELSKITGLNVIAPIEPCGPNMVLYSCLEHGIEVSENDDDNQQIIRIFHPDQEPTTPCIENHPCIDKIERLQKDAELGNLKSQWKLGLELGLREGGEHPPEVMIHWLTTALDGGYIPDWIFFLPEFLGGFEIAEKYLLRIANASDGKAEDIIDACDTLAFSYSYMDRNIEAEQYYLKAVDKSAEDEDFNPLKASEFHERLANIYRNWRDLDGNFAPRHADALCQDVKAEQCYIKAIEESVADEEFDLLDVAEHYERLSGLYRNWHDLDGCDAPRYADALCQNIKAEQCLSKALREETYEEELVHICLGDLFFSWIDVEGVLAPRYVEAIYHYEQAAKTNSSCMDFLLEKLEELKIASAS